MDITAQNNIEEHHFHGFRYFKDTQHRFPQIERSKQYPYFLYKYYSFSQNSLNALKSSYLYASHPYQLNDILDSSKFLLYSSKPLEFKVYENILGELFEDREELKEYYLNDIKPGNNSNGYIQCFYHVLSKFYGIISLSENKNETLMWPHYTQEKGFQLKFILKS